MKKSEANLISYMMDSVANKIGPHAPTFEELVNLMKQKHDLILVLAVMVIYKLLLIVI